MLKVVSDRFKRARYKLKFSKFILVHSGAKVCLVNLKVAVFHLGYQVHLLALPYPRHFPLCKQVKQVYPINHVIETFPLSKQT